MKKIQRLNIIDIEATCWETQVTPDGRNQTEVSEIIEIGIVQVDVKTLEILDKESYFIKPVIYPKLSNFCIKLTGITDDILKDAGSYSDVIKLMSNRFKIKKYEWASWGDYDRVQFERQCKRENIKYVFNRTHTNIKYWLSYLTGLSIQQSVGSMLNVLGMKFEGRAHRAIDDAYNIARMFTYVIGEIKIDIKEI